ncbi:hypothetical protein PRIPAC_78970 [Pristionchus pacificus]|uniref:G protein-coupled receptor n=1 Tax=Pristionchus pacificus TaxID=54126 RepID=A0A2A6C2J6_PRIPA|nr:hypothetical protein PRIPAC_78970 [Pristionchus pacificus]|eukprot:PDM72394.1 G protein-coupled receptor [Pristionchus pacificus]
MIDRVAASSLLAFITSIGLISNAFALYAVYRFKHLHNTFGALCAVIGAANFWDSLIHLLWSAYGPYLLEFYPFGEAIIRGHPGKIVGQISSFFLDLKGYAHLGYYSIASDTTVTSAFVTIPISFAFIQVAPFFWTDDCYLLYSSEMAIWEYADTPCNNFYSFHIDFILPVCVYCCIIVLDIITVFTLRKALDISQWNQTLKEKRKLEIGFFIQSLFQMGLSLLAYASFFGFSQYATDDWTLFGTTTVVWASVHSVDGVIMASFHARKAFIKWQSKITPASSVNGETAMKSLRNGEAKFVVQQ